MEFKNYLPNKKLMADFTDAAAISSIVLFMIAGIASTLDQEQDMSKLKTPTKIESHNPAYKSCFSKEVSDSDTEAFSADKAVENIDPTDVVAGDVLMPNPSVMNAVAADYCVKKVFKLEFIPKERS